ncbi:glucan 1,3-beta-glucosidase-like isoform X2 [Nymphaea colorata]|nr:glucan 1,3-beta-glucosidase-like isoform X2 [Nymphaea colorata]
MNLQSSTMPEIACLVGELNGAPEVRGVNLGGWLLVEGWIKPSLFDGIPNGDMLDGTKVQFKSVMLQKYMSIENGGVSNITVGRDNASSWETFKLWRISEEIFQFQTLRGKFLTFDNEALIISATAESSTMAENFLIERYQNKVHIKLLTMQIYLQTRSVYQLTAYYQGVPDWGDNAAPFDMIIFANDLHGDYQLANGYEPVKAKSVIKQHRDSFVTPEDFRFLSLHGINAVRIPVGWWIAQDPNPPAPFVGGTLAALDNAFLWAQAFGLKCIIDLHAAPASQNEMEHSASRDDSSDWASNPSYISRSLVVIDFLSSRCCVNSVTCP